MTDRPDVRTFALRLIGLVVLAYAVAMLASCGRTPTAPADADDSKCTPPQVAVLVYVITTAKSKGVVTRVDTVSTIVCADPD